MKHTLKITMILVLLFLSSQIIGLYIVSKYVDVEKTEETGKVAYKDLPYTFERPETEGTWSFLYIVIAVIVGTVLALLLVKYRSKNLWKIWFFLASWMCLGIAFSALMNSTFAIILAFVLALWKVLRTNFFVHNITELFIYAGIAAIFVPILNIWAAFILLIIISVYDWIAVLKTKHMVTLATSDNFENAFPGLYVQYPDKNKKATKQSLKSTAQKSSSRNSRTAVLGGGDIAFPLLFSGVAMSTLGFANAAIISLCTAAALLVLFVKAEKGKFYPAMPIISAGCFIGYGIAYVLFIYL